MLNVKNCTHIKVTGVRCGSPALRGEQFCYFHQRMMRGVQIPSNARLHPIALIENEEAIQASLMEVINALVRNTIDLKRAELILRALHIAVRNVRRVRFGLETNEMIREAPNYPAPPKPAADSVHEGSAQVMTTDVATAHVGTAALGCPGGPAVSGRSAVASAPDPTSPKTSATQTAPEALDPIQRKPPARAGLPAERAKVAASMRAAKGSY